MNEQLEPKLIALKGGVERFGGFQKVVGLGRDGMLLIIKGYDCSKEEFFQLWSKVEPLDYFKYACPEYELWADVKSKLLIKQILKDTGLKEKDLKEIWRADKKKEKDESEKENKEVISGNFIFNESQVVNNVVFSSHKIGNTFGYGFLLPKEVPIYSKVKKGESPQIVARRQIRSPAVITSDRKLIEPNPESEAEYKLKYVAIPNEQELRIDLATIKNFLDKSSKSIGGKQLFEHIKEQGYQKFMYFQNPIWYDIHALWDTGTYFFQLFNTYPILELRGLSGTAKSKTMNVSRLFSLNPTSIMVNPSEATLFRTTHTNRPTKYIDEAEKLFVFMGGKWISSPVVELINGSYTKGSAVPRLEKDGNSFKLIYYQCYSPTMIGSITGLRDATETRAITHIMTKAPDRDTRGELEVEDYINEPIYQELRNQLYLFAWENWNRIEQEYQSLRSYDGLKKRDFQLWKPLLAIAKVIDSSLYESILEFAVKTSKQKRQDFLPETSLEYQILQFLKNKFVVQSRIYMKQIAETLSFGDKKYNEKTISSNTDKLGFKEYRNKDRNGSYLEVPKDVFETIINTLIPDYSSQSSQSSQSNINDNKISDEQVTNRDEYINQNVTNVTNRDENDEYIEKASKLEPFIHQEVQDEN